jgi:hypothetical protein
MRTFWFCLVPDGRLFIIDFLSCSKSSSSLSRVPQSQTGFFFYRFHGSGGGRSRGMEDAGVRKGVQEIVHIMTDWNAQKHVKQVAPRPSALDQVPPTWLSNMSIPATDTPCQTKLSPSRGRPVFVLAPAKSGIGSERKDERERLWRERSSQTRGRTAVDLNSAESRGSHHQPHPATESTRPGRRCSPSP